MVKDRMRKVIRDRQQSLSDLVHAMAEYRKRQGNITDLTGRKLRSREAGTGVPKPKLTSWHGQRCNKLNMSRNERRAMNTVAKLKALVGSEAFDQVSEQL